MVVIGNFAAAGWVKWPFSEQNGTAVCQFTLWVAVVGLGVESGPWMLPSGLVTVLDAAGFTTTAAA